MFLTLRPNWHSSFLAQGTYTDKVTSVQITTSKTVYQLGIKSGESFGFEVPSDHHVIGFHGYAGIESFSLQHRI